MNKLTSVLTAALLITAVGCGKKDKDKAPAADPKIVIPETKTPEAPPPPVAATAEEVVRRSTECFGFFNERNADGMKGCYADNATIEIIGMQKAEGIEGVMKVISEFQSGFSDIKMANQLTLVNGNNLITVDLVTGTNDGAMMNMPATNKKMGMMIAHVMELDLVKRVITAERVYMDAGTMMGQLGLSKAPHRAAIETGVETPTVVLATNSEAETAFVAVTEANRTAMNAGDMKSHLTSIADNVVCHEHAMPSDLIGKASIEKMMKSWMKGFPNSKLATTNIWGAGDFVVSESVWSGKNTGPMPEMGLKKATNKDINVHTAEIARMENGLIAETWSFMNSAEMVAQLGLMPPPAAK